MTSTPAAETHAGLVPHPSAPRTGLQLAVYWTTAFLVVAQAVVVGLQVVGRLLFRHPIPWTEEIARLLLVWLMCAGGIGALANGQHPRVTALVRLLRPDRREAVDRGLRIVLLLFFVGLIGPGLAAHRDERRGAAAGERPFRRGDFRGAAGGAAC